MPVKIYRKNVVVMSDSKLEKRFAEIEADLAELEKDGWKVIDAGFMGQSMLVLLSKPG